MQFNYVSSASDDNSIFPLFWYTFLAFFCNTFLFCYTFLEAIFEKFLLKREKGVAKRCFKKRCCKKRDKKKKMPVLSEATKLRQLGLQNQIVDDLKWDSNEFRRRLYNNSDFKVEIGLWLKDDVNIQLKLTNFLLRKILIHFWWISIHFW